MVSPDTSSLHHSQQQTPSTALRKAALRIFTRKHNLQLHASAVTFIQHTLDQHGILEHPSEWDDAIEALANGILQDQNNDASSSRDLDSSVVTQEALERVYAQLVVADSAGIDTDPASHHDLTHGERPNPERYFHLVDAFSMPRLSFDPQTKTFHKSTIPSTLLPAASAKSLYLRERLQILKAAVLRNENFAPTLELGPRQQRDSLMKLTSTTNLLGRQGQRFLLLGMLSTSHDGRYVLEDADGSVGLDLDEAIPGEGIFTEGAIILVEGEYTDEERIRVLAIGHPPSETRKQARQIYSHVDFLGTGTVSLKDEQALRVHEQIHDELCISVLSDVHLDHPKTLSNLRAMFQGYVDADFIPFAFVLCGNFSSTPWTGADMLKRYQTAFATLADLLAAFPDVVARSHFVLVPGPADPFTTPVMPRSHLPDILTSKLKARLGDRLHLASNPCRIAFFSQEIVIYRDDIMARMLRNTVRLKEEAREGDLKKFLVSTLLDQAHLCPLPQSVRPILWEHDHALRLYPMPSALVLADSYDRFELTYEGCHVFNPGSFRGSAFAWTTYYPSSGRAERSELPQS